MDIQTILAIAEKHNNPGAEIQYKSRMTPTAGEWINENMGVPQMVIQASRGYEYRIKPKTVTLNGEELPKNVNVISPSGNYFNLVFESIGDRNKWESALKKLLNS